MTLITIELSWPEFDRHQQGYENFAAILREDGLNVRLEHLGLGDEDSVRGLPERPDFIVRIVQAADAGAVAIGLTAAMYRNLRPPKASGWRMGRIYGLNGEVLNEIHIPPV